MPHRVYKKHSGFTLIEVVLAMMIMTSGLMILTNSWAGTYGRLSKTQIQVQMAALLERKVYEIEREYKGKPLDTIPETLEDTFGSELPEYTWKMTSQKLEIPDLTPILTAQADAAKDTGVDLNLETMMKMFTEHLSSSIKEVKVEVIFKGKASKKPLSIDVVIYMIDYDKQLPIPGAGGAS